VFQALQQQGIPNPKHFITPKNRYMFYEENTEGCAGSFLEHATTYHPPPPVHQHHQCHSTT
jgi:hypothetical protein